ncbi:MAG: sulfurtransferase [Nitrospiraceae bacterium]|nr:MAG: sulfurtransferase [Nitrospiraceae bacterium]
MSLLRNVINLRHSKFRLLIITFILLFVFSFGMQSVHANGSSPLVETEWVADNMKNLKLVYVGFVGEQNKMQYDGNHLAGSAYLGMKDIMSAMTATPDKANFEKIMGQIGVSNDSHVILYSTPAANPFVPATYWLMKYFGHQNVSIMNGSLDKWLREGRKTDAVPPKVAPATYTAAAPASNMLADAAYVQNNLKNNGTVIIDTRGADEFTGQKEIDYIKAKGHIPGAKNLNFYPTNRNGDGSYKAVAQLQATYEAAGVTKDNEIITYCESGPRAADAYFALKELLGYPNVKVYVGSWMEWGNDAKYPVEK